MPTLKTLDIMIFELIKQHSPVEMFVVGPVITSWQSILSTLLDDAFAFAFLCHLHGCCSGNPYSNESSHFSIY